MTGSRFALLLVGMAFLIVPCHAAPSLLRKPPPPSVAPGQAKLPAVSLQYDSLSGDFEQATVLNPLLTYGGELTIRADRLQGDVVKQVYDALGHVRVHDADTTLTSTSLKLDGPTDFATADTATLTQQPFTARAKRIDLTPTAVTATDGTFTTAPPGTKPDLEARFTDLTLYPQRRNGIMHHASIYLLRTRLITLRRVSFNTGGASQSSRSQGVLPSVGVSGRYGPYLAYSGALAHFFDTRYRLVLPTRQTLQLRVSSRQSLFVARGPQSPPAPSPLKEHDYLGAIRQLATAPRPPLPGNDPLLFHSYLPEPDNIRPLDGPTTAALTLNEEVSTHQEATGRRRDDLYVYRLPEIGLNGALPLRVTPPPPTDGSPTAYRAYLRRLLPVAFGTVAYGDFEEQPDHLRATRQSDSIGLTTRPLLVSTDTLFQPRLQYTRNYYGGHRGSYRYLQGSVEVNRYFTPYSAVSVQYLAASTAGDSPFNFDVLDTSKELKIRVQMGNRRLAVAGQIRFDLTNGGVYDYKLAVAPGLNGITPVFSYNFRNRSFGLGADIPGLTF